MSLASWIARSTLLLALPLAAQAAQFPNQPIRLNVGFPPGTAPDIVARFVGQEMGQALGQSVVVENRAGAGGQIAAQAVARAEPDGYTLLLGEVGSLSIAPAAFPSLPYNVGKDFTPVSEVASADFVLVVPANSPYKTVEEFVKGAKASSDRLNFATFGAATPGHFGAELFAKSAGFKIEPVHYRSTGDAVSALASGTVSAGFITTAMASQQVAGGKMRALASTGKERASIFPDLPTFTEAGFPDVAFSAWMAIVAPTGTPPAAIAALQESVVKALKAPGIDRKLGDMGLVLIGSSPEDLGRVIQSDTTRWQQIVKDTGFKPE